MPTYTVARLAKAEHILALSDLSDHCRMTYVPDSFPSSAKYPRLLREASFRIESAAEEDGRENILERRAV